jgi:hypothetical protein
MPPKKGGKAAVQGPQVRSGAAIGLQQLRSVGRGTPDSPTHVVVL